MMLAVDPGINICSYALFNQDNVLYRAACVRDRIPKEGILKRATFIAGQVHNSVAGFEIDEIVIEWPQIYRFSKGDPNDLLALTAIAGALAATFWNCSDCRVKELFSVLPREWKGQETKEATQKRVKDRLTEAELEAVELPTAKSLQHNVWDAIGIGLHHAGRYGRKLVIHR